MVRSGFWNFCFWDWFVTEMLGTAYGLSRELCVGCFLGCIQKLTFWTKSIFISRPSMAGFMVGND